MMGRTTGEQLRQFTQVDAVSPFECELTDLVLLDMVITTQADRPAIRGLEAHAAVGIAAHMRAFDGTAETAWHTAVVAAYPGAMGRALAAAELASPLTLKPVREL